MPHEAFFLGPSEREKATAPGDTVPGSRATAHVDRFVLDRLPDDADLPIFLTGPEVASYPERLNAAVELVDAAISDGLGERVAIVTDEGRWSYRALSDLSSRIAGFLVDAGLVAGSRVLLRGPNTAFLAAAWLGVLKAGCIAVTTIPLLRARDLAPIVERALPTLAIIDAATISELEGLAWLQEAGCATFTFDGDRGSGELEARIAEQVPLGQAVFTMRDDPALLAFTSGTTGVPKATVHFHRDLLIPADGFSAQCLGARASDRFCCSAPFGFTFGLGASILFPLRARATSILAGQSTPAALLDAVERHRATVLLTAPTAYRSMLMMLEGRNLSELRLCVSAGEHLPAATQLAWRDSTGLGIMDGIGATEMMHIFIASDPATTPPGSCGRVVPGYQACVLDDDGRPMDVGEGRLAVRGPTGCRYLADPRQSAYVVDGWNVTGDTYRIDDDGNFWFIGRSDEMIVSSGYNIAPAEVEAVLASHPAVTECAVVGARDEARGMIVKAYIVPRQGCIPDAVLAAELQRYVKAEIAPYKYPRVIAFVDDLPKTPTGKLRRLALKDE